LHKEDRKNLLGDESEKEQVRGRGNRLLGVFPFLLSAHVPGDKKSQKVANGKAS
jgi:hypothetical protein